tara:strand:+ start:218 stop:427 length:210 start_codon:yes stop_codon:yes gene_type:complete
MANRKKQPLVPRRRVGKAIPIEPFDHETANKPNPPTKFTHGELRIGIGLVVILLVFLVVIYLAEFITKS